MIVTILPLGTLTKTVGNSSIEGILEKNTKSNLERATRFELSFFWFIRKSTLDFMYFMRDKLQGKIRSKFQIVEVILY